MTSYSQSSARVLYEVFHDRIWQSDHDFLIAFHSNFLSAIGLHGFRDNKVLLQAGYDVIMISPPGALSGDFLTHSKKATMTSW